MMKTITYRQPSQPKPRGRQWCSKVNCPPPKLIISCRCRAICASFYRNWFKHWFSKYRVRKFGNRRMHGRTLCIWAQKMKAIKPETVPGYHWPRFVGTIHRQCVHQWSPCTSPCIHLLYAAKEMLQSATQIYVTASQVYRPQQLGFPSTSARRQ